MDELKRDDLKSGYVVELRSGKRFLVTRAGQFTKVLLDTQTGEWVYLNSHFDDNLCRIRYYSTFYNNERRIKSPTFYNGEYRIKQDDDIVNVYGLVQGTKNYSDINSVSIASRKIIWSRIPPVQMTKEQIEKELGYRIEIVKES